MNCFQWGDEALKAPQFSEKMSFVSSWISIIIEHHVIDLTCELPITEAMANINMANITLSSLINAHHRLMTGSCYVLENKDCLVSGCV